jgi:hypothetical protein
MTKTIGSTIRRLVERTPPETAATPAESGPRDIAFSIADTRGNIAYAINSASVIRIESGKAMSSRLVKGIAGPENEL